MQLFERCAAKVAGAWAHLYRGHRLNRVDGDRGDVPGWVMVTVMTAILVVAILGVFEPEIKTAITNALNNVTNSGGGK
jgi:hypothetical protein